MQPPGEFYAYPLQRRAVGPMACIVLGKALFRMATAKALSYLVKTSQSFGQQSTQTLGLMPIRAYLGIILSNNEAKDHSSPGRHTLLASAKSFTLYPGRCGTQFQVLKVSWFCCIKDAAGFEPVSDQLFRLLAPDHASAASVIVD